ncbi:MAG TPA: hypothetical protein VLA72_10175 [Anaerolineales bacterium]|nr:hypothetical protein [Anaerolineales bacterium]
MIQIEANDHLDYFSLVIRLWREKGKPSFIRSTVDVVQTGENLAFQSPTDLLKYLTETIGEENTKVAHRESKSSNS